MKKIIITALTLVLALTCLFSCGGGGVTVYSPESRVNVVWSPALANETDMDGFNTIVSAIKNYIGDDCRPITDDLNSSNFEIVVGDSNRVSTAEAKAIVLANTPDDGDTESYIFYCKDRSLAIYASSEFAMEIAVQKFVETYLIEDTLVISPELNEFKAFSRTAWYQAEDERITAEEAEDWEHRWDAVQAIIGKDGTDAMKRLYAYYGTDWLNWMAGLYDVDTGAFYYAHSARDYITFAPDVESTAQILYTLKNTGLFSWYDGYWGEKLPESLRVKLLPWLQGLQSKADGYFYHPQWGALIGTAAKGRHLDQAISVISVLGGSPLYSTPMERQQGASGVSTVISSFMDTDAHKSTVVAASSLPAYMQSEEAMKQYLDLLKDQYTDDGKFNSWGFGHDLSSERSQLEAAGIIDYVCEYLDEMQDTETGFWEPGATYNSLSGVIKIATVYSSAGRALPLADKMVDSAIDVILSDERVTQMCYIYNPIGAFSSILGSMKKTDSTAAEAARQKFIAKLPDIIEKTIEKFETFRMDDGSFSYLPGMSDANSQGLRISLGFKEGDVNATAVGIDYITGALFGIIGTKVVPMFRYADYKSFCNNIDNAGAIIKQDIKLELMDFEDEELPPRLTAGGNFRVEVVDDPRENTDSEKVMEMEKTVDGATSGFVVDATTTLSSHTCFSVSMDMCFNSADALGYQFELSLENSLRGSDGRVAYMLWFIVSDTGVGILDYSAFDNQIGEVFYRVPFGTWFNLRIEYYFIDTKHAKIKLYIDDQCVYISENSYYTSYDFENYGYKYVYNYVDKVKFTPWRTVKYNVMIDNIYCEPSVTKTFDASDYTAQ